MSHSMRKLLRVKSRVNYYEPEEPSLDEYVFCEKCADYVYEYCAIHGALLVIPDDKVSYDPSIPAIVPRAALTIPRVFLHLARSIIPGAGIGVFSTLTLPRGVRFGPYRGQRSKTVDSMYCWQIYDRDNRRSHFVDGSDSQRSNWMRYVNCARHWTEQNLVAYQYRGQLYYRTIKIVPRFTELLVFYGNEYANLLHVDMGAYNAPKRYAAKFGASVSKKSKTVVLKKKLQSTNSIKLKKKEVKVGQYENIARTPIADKHSAEKDNPQPPDLSGKIKYGINCNQINTRGKRQTRCNICEKYFRCKRYLTTSTGTRNDESTYKCDVCVKYFSIKSKLDIHTRTHTGEKPYKCDVCEKCFSKKNNLDRHTRIHTGEKPYKCDVCEKCFSKKNNLDRHTRTHTGEKPYKCDVCEKCFGQKNYLDIHTRTHTGEKPYKCDVCEKCFSQKNNLDIHTRTHTGEKPYKCDVCEKCFSQKKNLDIHTRTHTGEKPYKCDVCEKCFGQKNYLDIHTRTHTGEKPYKCDVCEKCFSQKNNLDIHTRTHTGEKPYKCDVCEKCFGQKNYLDIHTRTHTGEKPYKCDVCEKCFSHKVSLDIHTRTHTGEKPYKCDVCEKCFSHKVSLDIHTRTHSTLTIHSTGRNLLKKAY